MAHPRRADMAYEVEARGELGAIVWDTDNHRWETGRRCLELGMGSRADWWLIVQDDAVLPRRFMAGVERALNMARSLQMEGRGPKEPAPVSFYVGGAQPFRRAVLRAVRDQSQIRGPRGAIAPAWLRMPELNWGVAVAYPTHLLGRIVAGGDGHPNHNYDARAGHYFAGRQVLTWYTWPSLVDHRAGPSLVPGRTATRHALRFIGAEAHADAIGWNGPVLDLQVRRLSHDAAAVRP